MVKESNFDRMIGAICSVRGYSTFHRHHTDLEDRTHVQTNKYSSGHSTLMLQYYSSMVYSLLEKMIFAQLVKKFSAVYGTRLYINPLNAELNPIRHLLALVGARHIVHVSRIRVKITTARHKTHRQLVKPTALLYVLRPGLLSSLLHADFSLVLYMLLYLLRHTTRISTHPILFELIILVTGTEKQYWSSSLRSATLHLPATFSIVGPKIVNTSLSDILHLPSSNISQGSYQLTIKDNTLFTYILNYMLSDTTRLDMKIMKWMVSALTHIN